jgi:hypothetical protein
MMATDEPIIPLAVVKNCKGEGECGGGGKGSQDEMKEGW